MLDQVSIIRTSIILISGLLISELCAQNSEEFPWPSGKKAALSLSFDDARLSNVDVGLDLFKKQDVKVTYYVVPGGVEQRLSQWKQAVADGHEIANHTLYHPCSGNFSWARSKALENYNLASMRQELLEANQKIKDLLNVEPVSFAYSCGQTFVGRGAETRSYVPLVAELFESGRGWLNEATNDPWFADFAQLQGIEMDGKDFEPDIRPLLEGALEQGTWVLLAGHEIGPEGDQTTRTKMLEELMAYVKEEHPEIWLAPVGEITAYVKQQRKINHQNMIRDLTFYSSFDRGTDADFGKGDLTLYTANSYDKPDDARSGIQVADIYLGSNQGRYGNGLVFKRKTKESLYYQARENVNYSQNDLEGTISFWLSLNPEEDLEPGYCDPLQITDVGYNDAAFWVDFSNKNPRLFRMGVFGDLKVWNPTNTSPDDNPDFNNRLIVAKDRPFGHGVWTHIVMVYDQLNSEAPGKVHFYVNGKLQGERNIPEAFTWDLNKAKIFLGLNYVGGLDDLAIFKRALNSQEINAIYQLDEGISSLLKAD